MAKLIEAINNIVKLIGSLLSLGLILAVLGGGFWAYTHIKGILGSGFSLPSLSQQEPSAPTIAHVDEPDDPPGQTAIACYHKVQCASADAHYDRIFFEDCAHTPFCADMYGHKQKFAEEVAAKCAHSPRCKTVGEHWLKFWPEWHLARKLKLQGKPLPAAMTTAPAPKVEPSPVSPTEVRVLYSCPHTPACKGAKWVCVAKVEAKKCPHSPSCGEWATYFDKHYQELYKTCVHQPKCPTAYEHFVEYHLDIAYPPDAVKAAQEMLKQGGLKLP